MKRQFIIPAVVAALLSLTGCKTYRTNYERPKLVVDSVKPLRAEYMQADSNAVIGWREMFTDPYLQQLISDALKNNTDLQVARLKIEEAQASLYAANMNNLPTVDGVADGSLSKYGGSSANKTYNLGAEVSWEADIFGKLSNERKQSLASLEEQQTYAQAVRTQLVATVAQDYYYLLMYDEQVKLTKEAVESWKEYIQTEKALMKAGEATSADVSQAEASLLSAQSTLSTLQQSIAETENSLCALIGRQPGTIERSTLEEQQLSDRWTKGVSVSQLVGRPDVREAEAKLKSSFYEINIAKTAFYPSLNLSGQLGWTNSGGMGVANPGKILLEAAASLTQPIFNQGKNKANLRIAEAQYKEAALQWKQSILDAGKEVNNSISNVQTARQESELLKRQCDKLQETLRATKSQMKYGSVNYLQVIVARQSLLSAQLDEVQSRCNELLALVNLYQAVGGGTY